MDRKLLRTVKRFCYAQKRLRARLQALAYKTDDQASLDFGNLFRYTLSSNRYTSPHPPASPLASSDRPKTTARPLDFARDSV
jgi:hypothetical protein